MLRISEQNNPVAAKVCYAPAVYYEHGQGIVGLWGGKGASRLSLDGTVDVRLFGLLCDNLDPKTGRRLTVRTRRKRTIGYTFRFSAAKSVSLLYGLSGDGAILSAFRSAVKESMHGMEVEMKTRVRRAGLDTERTTGNMVWAEFVHTTACPVRGLCDPQLHAYVFVFNMTWDEREGRWKAGYFRDIKRDAPYFQAAFRVCLANKLQDLGFGVERRGDDFEVAGIPPGVLQRFSRRTEVIENMARERGITNPKWKAELGRKTREHDGPAMTPAALREQWKSRLNRRERQTLMAIGRRDEPFGRPSNGEAVAVDQAIARCFGRHLVVPERTLITEALKRGLGAVTVSQVLQELTRRPLDRNVVNGKAMVRIRRN